jgi:hypothetical protein
MKPTRYTTTTVFFFFHFFNFEILVKVKKNLAKLVEFTIEKKKFPRFSPFLCQKMAKFDQ